MKNHTYTYVLLALTGLVLPFVSLTLSAIYAAIAFVLLAGVQVSLLPSSGSWAVVGGKPTAKIEGKRKVVSISAVGMLASVLCSFLVKLAWLRYAS